MVQRGYCLFWGQPRSRSRCMCCVSLGSAKRGSVCGHITLHIYSCLLSCVLPVQVPDHCRAEDIPVVMPQKQYSTLGIAAKGPSPPIAWKLDAPKNVSKSRNSQLLCHNLKSAFL